MSEPSDSKRPKLTYYTIDGRDHPVARVLTCAPLTPERPTRGSKGRKKKPKPGPRTITFRVEGTLLSGAIDSTSSACHSSEMTGSPAASVPPMDEFTDLFNDPIAPNEIAVDVEPVPTKKVRPIAAYIR